jgi:hypothetical protein
MDPIQIARHSSGLPLRTSIHLAMHRFMEETVAFHEIAKLLDDPDEGRKRRNDWLAKYSPLLSKDEQDEFTRAMGQFREGGSKDARGVVSFTIELPEAAEFFHTFLKEASRGALVNRAELVSRAFQVAAVSTFEVMFGSLARSIYRRNPTALARSDYSFTLEELERYESIDEAREELINRRVDGLLADGVDGWLKWLNSTIKLDLAPKIDCWPNVREIFARRNVIVHADGKIDRRYIEILKQASISTDGLHIGDSLDHSVAKLVESLECLIATAVILAFSVWTRLDKAADEAASKWELAWQEYLVDREMWTAVRSISLHLAALPCSRATQLQGKVNGWLAQKFIAGLDSISDEVSRWDVSGLDREFCLAQSLLLDKDDSAMLICALLWLAYTASKAARARAGRAGRFSANPPP